MYINQRKRTNYQVIHNSYALTIGLDTFWIESIHRTLYKPNWQVHCNYMLNIWYFRGVFFVGSHITISIVLITLIISDYINGSVISKIFIVMLILMWGPTKNALRKYRMFDK